MLRVASMAIHVLGNLLPTAIDAKLAPIANFDFLTNHAHVLLCISRDPGMRLREIAGCVGITERAAHRIVCELEAEGYLTRRREGRRNVYEIHPELPLRHDLEQDATAGDLILALAGSRAA